MPNSFAPPALPADLPGLVPTDELLAGLLDASLSAVALYQPLFDPAGTIIDFRIVLLNPAAQRILRQPARPSGTYLHYYPHTGSVGVFDFHCRVFRTGQPERLDVNYQADGLDNYFRLSGRRVGELLLVSFTDSAEESRTAVEEALRESQAREQAAHAEAERQRRRLHDTFMQAPAMICIFDGPEHVFELVNPGYQTLVGNRPLLGRPIAEAMPELAGQPIFELLDTVYRTGQPFHATEMLVQLDRDNSGPRELGNHYYNFSYQPRLAATGRPDGILVFAYDVTEQVLARQLIEEKERQLRVLYRQSDDVNEELATTNEELEAANEEIRINNEQLYRTEQSLRELNLDLESRVTERTAQLRQAQADAERQRARLYRFFMQAPAAICILDGPELVYELVNPAYQALFPGRQLLNHRVLDALPEIIGHAIHDTLRLVYETGMTHEEPSMLVSVARPTDGQLEDRYFNYIQQARYDEHGHIDGVLVFAFEVTEKVLARRRADALQEETLRAARRLAEQRELFYQVFEQTPALVCILRGPEHRTEYANPSFRRLYAGRELLGRPVAETQPEAVAQGFVALLDQLYQTGQTINALEVLGRVRQPDGSLKEQYFNYTYQAYRENGNIVGVSVFAFEVTEQVLARQQGAIQQEQLRTLLEQAPVAIAVFQGSEHVVELANPAMCAIWGRTPAQVLGLPLHEALPEVGIQGFISLLDDVFQTGVPYVAREFPTLLQRHGHRESTYLNFVYQPMRDVQGTITGITVVATDVTDHVTARRQLSVTNDELLVSNQALDTTNQQLTRINQDLDNFVYTASHDLKQPVDNMAGLFDELKRTATFHDPQAGLMIQMFEEALGQIDGTIRGLAAVVQTERLSSQMPTEAVALLSLTQSVIQSLHHQASQLHADFQLDFSALPTVHFACLNLQSIVYNLLSNALKYAHPDRPPVVKVSSTLSEAGAPLLTVQDNGLGLDVARYGSDLFQMFRRFHDHTTGSGMGLYLVNRILRQAGGHIDVASTVGEGTTFRIHLPATALPPA